VVTSDSGQVRMRVLNHRASHSTIVLSSLRAVCSWCRCYVVLWGERASARRPAGRCGLRMSSHLTPSAR
jgi:hypothetical protein